MMNKKLLAIPALLVAIGGGTVLAQSDLFVNAENNPSISAQEAKEIALKQVNGTIIDFDYDDNDRTPHYEIDIKSENEKVEVEVNAQNGDSKVTEREAIKRAEASADSSLEASQDKSTATQQQTVQSTLQPTSISEDAAIKIARAKAPGTVVKAKLDNEDNRQVYEIEIRNGKTEYEFNIDATTGAIVEFEQDLNDDNN